MDAVIPCQKFPLQIFEPRYRLMFEGYFVLTPEFGQVFHKFSSS
ncbi:hypothetical protein OIU77_000638 [Salix suchowensis]|uniref:Uncharacterized protein n=1 Tax=Salix suchowensis TaxID=1278906 RepID=A0ABQ9B6R9_9ROSI|nr:hypothetical protein OIU77_000638 [Salix suchowensis]